MKRHKRSIIQVEAELAFAEKYSKILNKKEFILEKDQELTYEDCVHALSMIMVNLSKNNQSDNNEDSLQGKLQKAFDTVKEEFELTFAESIQIITTLISREMKYLKRYERHGDYDSPADFE